MIWVFPEFSEAYGAHETVIPRQNMPVKVSTAKRKVTMKTLLILLTLLVTTRTNKCKTDDNKSCVFPFTYRNKTYAGCTAQHDPDGELWCSTQVTSEGEHVVGVGEWGHCQSDCPRHYECGVVEVKDKNKDISSGIYLVDKGNYHHGRPVYVNTKNNFNIFWLDELSGWGLGKESGILSEEVLYTSGPDVSGEPWQGTWRW